MKTTDFLREKAGGFLNFPSVVQNSISEDFVVIYAVLVYSAAITRVSLNGINDTVFDFLDNTGVVGLSIL